MNKILLTALFGLSATAQAADFKLDPVNIPSRECKLEALLTDGNSLQTQALQNSIDHCAETGGGKLQLPAGDILSGPLFLKNKVHLALSPQTRLLASTERDLYKSTPANKKFSTAQGWISFINAADVNDVEISGGVIDGQGKTWWDYYLANEGKSKPTNRPRLVYFSNVQRALLQDLTLTNSPSFHFVPSDSAHIEVNRVRILAPRKAPNTDAIDPSNTRNMLVHNCEIDTGDDNIAIKAGHVDPAHPGAAVENITVADCVFRAGHGASIGTETTGGVRNVVFERIRFIGTDHAVRIKSMRGRSGEVRDVIYRDLTLENVKDAILITGYYPQIPAVSEEKAEPYNASTPYFYNILLQNIQGTADKPGYISGLPERRFDNLRLENIRLQTSGPLPVRHASVTLHKVDIGGTENPLLKETDADLGTD